MIIKILFTLTVIIVVVLIFRQKRARHGDKTAQSSQQSAQKTNQSGSLSTRTVAYGILAILMALSITLFIVSNKSDNKITNIRVIAEDGMSTHYQAKQKSIKGRRFVTLDGKQVTLGESDRIEITP